MRFLVKNFLIIFLLIFLGCGYFIACTEAGLQTTIQILSGLIPGKLVIQNAKGKLVDQFTLNHISYQNTGQQITIQKLNVNWKPAGLLQDKVFIENITLENANVKITSTPNQTTTDAKNHWFRFIIVKQFILKNLVIQYDDMQINFDGALSDKWDARWQAKIPHLNRLEPNLSGSALSSGTISGPLAQPQIRADLSGSQLAYEAQKINRLNGTINFNFQPKTNSTVSLTAYDLQINNQKLPKLNLRAEGRFTHQDQALKANLKLVLADNYNISAQLSLPKFTQISDFEQPLKGKVLIESTHLEFLTHYFSEIKKPSGTAQVKLAVEGKLSQPEVTGELLLRDGHVEIPQLGISLEKIKLKATKNKTMQVRYEGSFQSGEGVGKAHGTLELATHFPLTLNLQGNNLQILKQREYNVIGSPNIQLALTDPDLKVQGNVFIATAEINPKSFENTVTLPAEVVFVDTEVKSTELPFDITLNVNLQLGNNIHVAYQDLQSNLSGKLRITKTPNTPMLATGELYAVQGTYRAYGQVLKISEGRLIFTGGPLLNPGLNIRASKQIKTVSLGGESSFDKRLSSQPFTPVYTGTESATVGVQIAGTLDHHNVSLFSNPSGLSQKDILSYLTLGHSITQATDQQKSALLNATSALNFGGKSKFGNVTEKLQSKLGLSELDVKSTEIFNPTSGKVSSTTTLVVGKELTPNLYAHYSKSLFDPIQILNLRYQLSKRFAIQSETSTIGNGADLLYSIERD